MAQEPLTLDKLLVKDVPSLHALGIAGAEALRHGKVAVFMVDVLGRVQVMSANAVEIKDVPRVPDSDLDRIPEEKAIQVMLAQGDSEGTIVLYLQGRATRVV